MEKLPPLRNVPGKINEDLVKETQQYIHDHPGLYGLTLSNALIRRGIGSKYVLEVETREMCEYRSDLGTNDRGWFCLCSECRKG